MVSSGGVAAAFGFRFQYVVTVGILLDLYQDGELVSWFVDVDLKGQDSADILVSTTGCGWDRALQVKASQSGASTKMGEKHARQILGELATEHPTVPNRHLITNRQLTLGLSNQLCGTEWSPSRGEHFNYCGRDLNGLVQEMLERVSRLRQRGAGGLKIHHIVLAQLIDLVHQRGSDPLHQRIVRSDVHSILAEPAALLADASQHRPWGRLLRVPHGQPIKRPEIDSFLANQLPLESLETGRVRCAVLHGLSGTGKSSSALWLVRERVDNMAFVLWLDASSEAALQAQLSFVLGDLGVAFDEGDPAEIFNTALQQVPVPWLLVLDNAENAQSIERWLPRSGYGHVVVTSTFSRWPGNFSPSIKVSGFSDDEGLRFLEERFATPIAQWSIEQTKACGELVTQLGSWPLALELATAWIKSRQGTLEQVHEFVRRIGRLDLDDPSLVPYGYPTTAYQAVVSLLDSLTENEKEIAVGIAIMGGRCVPLKLLEAWVAKCNFTAGACQGLERKSVITLSLHPDHRGPNCYDESVDIHDAIFLILKRSDRGVDVDVQHLVALVEVCATQMEGLIQNDRFIEVATLLPPIDALLSNCVENFGIEKIPAAWTTLMHNVGATIAVVGGKTNHPKWTMPIAYRWLETAVKIRQCVEKENYHPLASAALQIETIGTLGYVLNELNKADELIQYARYALELGERFGSDLSQGGSNVAGALRMLRAAVESQRPDEFELLEKLRKLEGSAKTGQRKRPVTPSLVDKIQEDMLKAKEMAGNAMLAEGVTLALQSAEAALKEGVLVTKSINGLLDIGLFLLLEVSRRPADHRLASDQIRRLLSGLGDFDGYLDPSQLQRTRLLQATAAEDTQCLRSAITDAIDVSDDRTSLGTWIHIAKCIYESSIRSGHFANIPEGMVVVTPSSQLWYWEAISADSGVPILFISNTGTFITDSAGQHPYGHVPFVEAGLTITSDPVVTQPQANGWGLQLQHDKLSIYAPHGRAMVQEISISSEFANQIVQFDGLLLVYHDDPQRIVEPLTAPAGWISFPRQSRGRGWRHFIPW